MTSTRLGIVSALILLTAAPSVSAQQIQGAPPGGRQGGPAPGQFPGAPPRDARTPAQTGSAVIRGRVFAADTGRPLRRARITVTPGDVVGIPARFVRSARPDQEGRYQIRGLPPGEYLAVAIDYVEEGMWNDPEYLESVRRYGQRLKLGENGTQAVSLKLVMPSTYANSQ